DLTARLQPVTTGEAAAAVDPQQAEQMRRELVDWAKGELAAFDGADGNGQREPAPQTQASFDDQWQRPRAPLELSTLDRRWQPVPDYHAPAASDEVTATGATREHRIDPPTTSVS